MKSLCLILTFLLIQNIVTVTFDVAMSNLEILEGYIKEYKSTHTTSSTVKFLTLCYIREGKYDSTQWRIAAGSCPSDLVTYISGKDTEKGTKAADTRTYGEINAPSGDKIDFVHIFACMNGIEYGGSYTGEYSTLVGWGGDTAQLAKDIKGETGTLDELISITRSKYLGIKGSFGQADLISDLDAPVILKKKTDSNTFSSIMKSYYKTASDYNNRVANFLSLTFPGVAKTQSDLRNAVYNRYNSDDYCNVLECNYGIRNSGFTCYFPGGVISQYKNHQKAAPYAFADYLYDKSK